MLEFEFNGMHYRTNGNITERLDGTSWHQTGSLPVVLYAKKLWGMNNALRPRNEQTGNPRRLRAQQ